MPVAPFINYSNVAIAALINYSNANVGAPINYSNVAIAAPINYSNANVGALPSQCFCSFMHLQVNSKALACSINP